MASPSEVPPPAFSRRTAAEAVGVIGRGQGGLETALLERDDADVHAARLGADERQRRLLRGAQAAGRHVGRGHAARDVHGQDDGAGGPRHRDGRRRARHGDREHGEAADGEPHAPEAGPAAPGAAPRPPAATPAATPAAARAAARRRVPATAAQARPAATSRPTARRTGSAKLTRACAWCSRRPSMSARARSASVPMRWTGTPARRMPAARRASRSPTPARSRARSSGSDESMTSCSPVSASSTTTRPTSGSSSSAVSVTRRATTSWRGTRRSSDRSQSPSPMKSEMTTIRARRLASLATASSIAARSVVLPRLARAAGISGPGELGGDAERVPAAGAWRHGAHRPGVVAAARRRGCRPGRTTGRAPGPARRARRPCRAPAAPPSWTPTGRAPATR